MRTLILSLILLVLTTSSFAGKVPATPQEWNVAYDSLLQRAKSQDSTIDFVELRVTFSRTTFYNPYGNPGHWRDSMYAARQRDDAQAILKFAALVLDSNYLDIDAHMLSGYACNKIGDTAGFERHRWIAKKLVRSIFDTGTGKTPEYAFFLISVDEQHTILNLMGVRVVSKSMVEREGRQLSLVQAVDPNENDKKLTIYFNLDTPIKWLRENSRLPKAG
jgi:hypothetical protein